MRKTVVSEKAPAAIGPYVHANIVNGLVFCSGQIPLDPATGKLVEGGIEEQTHRVFANISAILEECGCSLKDVVKTTCFLADMGDFGKVNEIYASYFPEGVYPSRSAFQVAALPAGALLEIEVIAEVE